MACEEWRPVVACGFYEVSNLGRVRRAVPGKGTHVGRIVKPVIVPNYPYGKVCLSRGGTRGVQSCSVHSLVAAAFLGAKPSPRHEVAHNDGDPLNNAAENLRWATPCENNSDKIEHGTHHRGERHPYAILTPDIVSRLREAKSNGPHGSVAKLARELGINKYTAFKAASGINWKYQGD